MRFHQLGQSELRVSELCLGTMTFGQQNTLSRGARAARLRRSIAASTSSTRPRCIRCPRAPRPRARTETYVGEWLAQRPRDKVVLATKIAGPGRPIDWVRGGSLAINRKNVRRRSATACAACAPTTSICTRSTGPTATCRSSAATVYEPGVGALEHAHRRAARGARRGDREGKVRYWGLSNETPWGVSEFARTATQLGLPRADHASRTRTA